MIDPERIQLMIRTRKLVEEVMNDFIPSILAEVDAERFWTCLSEEVAKKVGKRLATGRDVAVMSEKEAAKWEKTTRLPWGKHKGELICNVNPEYLAWFTDNDFNRDLIRYMRSQLFRRRQGLVC